MRQATRWPKRLAEPLRTAVSPAIIVMMMGRFARPARIGLQPKAYWKCRMSPNITPAMAIEVPIWATAAPRTVPPEKRREVEHR